MSGDAAVAAPQENLRAEATYDHPYTPEDGPEEWGGWRAYELGTFRQLGLTLRQACQMRTMRNQNFWRYSRVLNLLSHGVAEQYAYEVADHAPDGVYVYLQHRLQGMGHSDAFELALCEHTCRFGAGVVISDFNPVLGTGTRTTRLTCSGCGKVEHRSETRNWSGD